MGSLDGFVLEIFVFAIELLIFIRGGHRGRVVDGFDFFVCAAFGDQGFEGLDGFEDAVGDTVELAEDGEVGTVWGVVFAVEHVVVADVFHLEEAEFKVDELLEEHVLGGRDGLVFFEEVVDGDGDEVGMGYEMAVILHGVEAMLEGVGGRAGFAGSGAWAGGFLCVGAVGGEGGFGHGFLAWLVGYVRWIICN